MSVREWSTLSYLDPEKLLSGLQAIELEFPLSELPYEVSSLRKRNLRKFGEARQCALFCFLMSKVKGFKVEFAHTEKCDYDCIARYMESGTYNYVPIQMKEYVPENVNLKSDLESILASLTKYKNSSNLVVAIYLNRNFKLDLSELELPKLNLAEIWIFGSSAPDQSKWVRP